MLKRVTAVLAWERSVRMLADVVMVSGAFGLALAARYLWMMTVGDLDAATARSVYGAYVAAYVRALPLLLLVALTIFYLSGFYTRGRAYRSRLKALIVLQAVSLAYVGFAAIAFIFPAAVSVPRSVLLMAWAITLTSLLVARLWSTLWKAFAARELGLAEPADADAAPRVLVIGGGGYIGSALVPRLLDKGCRVRILDSFLYGEDAISAFRDHPNLEVVAADFRRVDKAVEAMKHTDTVIHLGALVGDPACALNEELTIEVNLVATRMLAGVARASGVRQFIFASTCSVYGVSDEWLDERSALRPVSLYARTKLASEKVVLSLRQGQFTPVVLRFATIYGLSGRCRFDLVANLLTAKAVQEGQITVYDGDQWRPFVHVDDVARVIVQIVDAPADRVGGEVFNVGSDEQNYTLEQLGAVIQKHVPNTEVLRMGSDGDRRNYRVSFRKIRNAVGFKPKWTLDTGIEQVVAALRSGRVADYQDACYSNVKLLTEQAPGLLLQNGWAASLMAEPADKPYQEVEM